MCKSGLCSCLVSICLSVTFLHCIQMADDIVKHLSRPGSPIILVFLTPSADAQFQGEPYTGGTKYMGWVKLKIFN